MKSPSQFKLPIEYDSAEPIQLASHIEADLNLENVVGEKFHGPESRPTMIRAKWSNVVSGSRNFLHDTKQIISQLQPTCPSAVTKYAPFISRWKELSTDEDFIERYMYLTPQYLRKFNWNPVVLQGISVYSLAAPILSLILPILSLVFPFAILKLQGVNITVSTYFATLRGILAKHPIGQIFKTMGNMAMDKLVYLLFTLGMYAIQIYQNVKSCMKYYENFKNIHNDIFLIRDYIEMTLKRIDDFIMVGAGMTCYSEFNMHLIEHKLVLRKMLDDMASVADYGITPAKFFQIGNIMRTFYAIHCDLDFKQSVEWSLGFNDYMDTIHNISTLVVHGDLGETEFEAESEDSASFKSNGMYHPACGKSPIKNDISTEFNLIITGPNASGKTTLIKSTMINAIVSQQIGFGFHTSGTSPLYSHFHCYLNIPDTSDRDSLFQSEAKRCKDILDILEERPKHEKHLCLMDELFSGTNPEEAVAGASAFLKHISNHSNMHYILTTHYIKLCKLMRENAKTPFSSCMGNGKRRMAKCIQMGCKTDATGSNLQYTYLVKSGITKIKGGTSVMRNAGFPKSIINEMELRLAGGSVADKSRLLGEATTK